MCSSGGGGFRMQVGGNLQRCLDTGVCGGGGGVGVWVGREGGRGGGGDERSGVQALTRSLSASCSSGTSWVMLLGVLTCRVWQGGMCCVDNIHSIQFVI
jgi:hypothetical protein